MINSESTVTEVESSSSNGGRLTQIVPTSGRWTTKLSSTADQNRIKFNRNDDLESVERNTSSSDANQPADIDASSNLENTNGSVLAVNYSSTIADVDLLWPEKMNKQSAGTDCFLQNDNQTNADTTATAAVDDLDSVSLELHENFQLPKTSKRPSSRKKSLRSKYRKPSKTKDVLGARTWRPFAETSSSEFSMTSLADDVGLWMMIAERAPLQASADNVSAIGYKSATLLSEEVATVSAAVASVLIFWSLLGTAVCLVLRMRRRKRRRLKRHSLDDVAHIDMLDEMIRTELARGRARLNTSCTASQSSPTYVNVPPPPPFAGFQTAFDSVQLMNSYNSISHNHNRQNVYEYFLAGTGSQFVASERHPLPTRSVYNSPNIERVACVRLSNARSFEVLQKTVRPKKIDFHRSRSFNEKSAKAVVHLSQEKPPPDSGRVRVFGSPNKRSGAKEAGCVSLRDGPILASGSRQELSWVGYPPIKTSFDKTRTPEHPTESTVLNSRGQYLPYHVQHHSATSSVLYGASRPYQDRSQGFPGNSWLGECRGPGTGDIRWRGYPSHHFVGCRPMNYSSGYCSSRPVRFPKMGQSCLVGELQRNASNPSSCSKSRGRETIEMLHCM